MKNIVLLSNLAFLLLLISCGKKTSELESKKEELANLKKQYAELKTRIDELETDIAKSGGKQELKSKDVAVSSVATTIFDHYIDVQGKVESDRNVLVNPEMNGVVEKVYVKSGDRVSKGQLLAQLDGSLIQQGIQEVKTQLEFAKTIYDKQQRLWDQKIGTEVQYLSAKTNVEALEKKLSTLQRHYSMCMLKAPISGTVDEVRLKEGELASPMMPAFRVVNLSDFKVVAELAESLVSKVDRQNEVILFFPDLNKEVKAKVSQKNDVIDPLNRTFKVEVAIAENVQGIRPNMIVKLKINDYKNKQAMVVPVNTVQSDDKGSFVLVAAKDKDKTVAKKQYVKAGVGYGDQVEITEGLTAGDQLITAGYLDLVAGEVVKF